MKKLNKKILLTLSSTIVMTGTVISIVSCGSYEPSRGDLTKKQFLAGKLAYNKVLADYYQGSVDKMFADKNNTIKVNLQDLKFHTYQWLIEANQIKDHQYWTTQKSNWKKSGAFIGSLDKNGTKIKNMKDNNQFIETLFVHESNTPINIVILKNDLNTFKLLGGGTKDGDKGSGVIMDVDRTLYAMAYLLLTKSSDVQNWFNPIDPNKSSAGKINILEENTGQYFFIDYLRNTKPFIMWKNEVTDPTKPNYSFNGTAGDVNTFNNIGNKKIANNNKVGTLELSGIPTKQVNKPAPVITAHLGDLGSYAGMQTTNPFLTTPSGGNSRSGSSVAPDDAYMETQKGGLQGWVNNDGSIYADEGNAVVLKKDERDYAYIQQLLPGWDKKQFTIADWMTKPLSKTSINSEWNVAFQIIFYGGSILNDAKHYWVNNGYDLKVFIPDLENNLSPAHIYK